MNAEFAALAATVQQIDDERQILNLLACLSHLADRGTIEDYLDLWARDGVWTGSADTAHGHDQLRARIERDRARGVQGPGSGTRHVSTTRYVRFVDRDTAESESYFVYFTAVAAEPRAARVGRYSDRLVRTDGRWKLASRRIVLAD